MDIAIKITARETENNYITILGALYSMHTSLCMAHTTPFPAGVDCMGMGLHMNTAKSIKSTMHIIYNTYSTLFHCLVARL